MLPDDPYSDLTKAELKSVLQKHLEWYPCGPRTCPDCHEVIPFIQSKENPTQGYWSQHDQLACVKAMLRELLKRTEHISEYNW